MIQFERLCNSVGPWAKACQYGKFHQNKKIASCRLNIEMRRQELDAQTDRQA